MNPHPLVLTVDDEPCITRLTSLVLSDAGFRMVTANGCADGLAKAESLRPDVVLLDLMMPGCDGFEVMRDLQQVRAVPIGPIRTYPGIGYLFAIDDAVQAGDLALCAPAVDDEGLQAWA